MNFETQDSKKKIPKSEGEDGLEMREEGEKNSIGGSEKNSNIESIKAELDEARVVFAQKKYESASAWERIKNVLGAHAGERDNSEMESLQANYQASLGKYMEARLSDAENLSEGEKGELAKEIFAFKMEEANRLFEEKTNIQAEKNSSYPLMKGMKNVGSWLSTNETGKKVMTGAGLAGTALGGVSAIVRRAMAESPKIAMKMGAEEEGKVVKGLEKVAGISKFITPMGIGKTVAGIMEKWQKSAQESYQEKKRDKFEKMSAEEQMMALMDFNKSSLDKLMGVLGSKKLALVTGGMAGMAVFMMTGEAGADILDGHINMGAMQEQVQNNVPLSPEFASDHVFSEADMAAGNLDEQMSGNAEALENSLSERNPGEERYVMSEQRNVPENLPIDESLEQENIIASDMSEEKPLAEEIPINQEQSVPLEKNISEDVSAQKGGIKSGKISFGSGNRMPEPESIPHTETAANTVFEQRQAPLAESAVQQPPSQSEATQQTASSSHVENAPIGKDVADHSESSPKPEPARIVREKADLEVDRNPVSREMPLGNHNGFEVSRVIPNIPGADKVTVQLLKENPLFAEKIERVQEAANVHFGKAGDVRLGETMGSYMKRIQVMAKVGKISPDAIFNRVI
jgi:hypothetical protein